MISMIVAVAENGVIGKDNQLIWHLPNDLKYFKEHTDGHTIIMGRKTLESLPFLLPRREHWVITQNTQYEPPYASVRVFHSVQEVIAAVPAEQEVFIIGGAQIYEAFMPYADTLYLTEIAATFEGDAYFPKVDADVFEKVSTVTGVQDEQHPWPYAFVKYARKELNHVG